MKRILIATCLVLSALFFIVIKSSGKNDVADQQYIVVGGKSALQLEKNVVSNMKNGWKLNGGVSYGDGYYLQAMYK
jgi:hypothetical protein